jgi:hypothetical protein
VLAEIEIGPADPIELTYPDGSKDAETLLVDPLSGDIYVIAKREFFCKVYRAAYPQSTAKQMVMQLVAILSWEFVTGVLTAAATGVIQENRIPKLMWRGTDGG